MYCNEFPSTRKPELCLVNVVQEGQHRNKKPPGAQQATGGIQAQRNVYPGGFCFSRGTTPPLDLSSGFGILPGGATSSLTTGLVSLPQPADMARTNAASKLAFKTR